MSQNLYKSFAPLKAGSDRAALVEEKGRVWTFRELDNLAGRLASAFSDVGCRPGDRIATQVEKTPEALALYLAALRGGFVFLPLNTAYKRNETEYLLRDSCPSLVIASSDHFDLVKEISPGAQVLSLDDGGTGSVISLAQKYAPSHVALRHKEDPAILLYTSGTTGRPKGAVLSHGALLANAEALVRCWHVSDADTILHTLPLFHAHGLTVAAHCAFLSGAKLRWHRRFDVDEVATGIASSSIFMGVPTMYHRLLGNAKISRESTKHIRLFTSGSSPLSPAALKAFDQQTGHVIVERYGMSETGINASNPLDGVRKPGSVGRPLDGVRIRVVDGSGVSMPIGEAGEVQISGTSLCSGYWQKPEATSESFRGEWFSTGDVGFIDEDSYLFLVSRIKEIIITGGYNVYPSEVEAALEQMPGIREAAVIGIPHPDFGEGVVAVVVTDGQQDEAATIRYLKGRLANYKVPKRVLSRDRLPRNAIGKIVKAEIKTEVGNLFD